MEVQVKWPAGREGIKAAKVMHWTGQADSRQGKEKEEADANSCGGWLLAISTASRPKISTLASHQSPFPAASYSLPSGHICPSPYCHPPGHISLEIAVEAATNNPMTSTPTTSLAATIQPLLLGQHGCSLTSCLN
ncbi:hypothetical protein MRB53_010125 [Persea americana]|uniref:Uncharacterized protein n=1 Tax=Persea americana TaxID=3435 RepID=A0ACC2LR22_PERAE|nr:hypothetical protein MRB53_010125 [Persea americana]